MSATRSPSTIWNRCFPPFAWSILSRSAAALRTGRARVVSHARSPSRAYASLRRLREAASERAVWTVARRPPESPRVSPPEESRRCGKHVFSLLATLEKAKPLFLRFGFFFGMLRVIPSLCALWVMGGIWKTNRKERIQGRIAWKGMDLFDESAGWIPRRCRTTR